MVERGRKLADLVCVVPPVEFVQIRCAATGRRGLACTPRGASSSRLRGNSPVCKACKDRLQCRLGVRQRPLRVVQVVQRRRHRRWAPLFAAMADDAVELVCGDCGATIVALGADLVSLRRRTVGGIVEELIEGATADWRGGSITLFPACGRHRDGMYDWAGERRRMALHGFISNCRFRLEGSTDHSECTATYEHEPGSEAAWGCDWPHRVSLVVTFTLSEASGLRIEYCVRNLDEVAAPFSIGNHISLRVPDWSHARVSCSVDDTICRELAPGSLLSGAVRPLLLRDSTDPSLARPLDAPVLDTVIGFASWEDGSPRSVTLHRGGSSSSSSVTITCHVPTRTLDGSPPTRDDAVCAFTGFVFWGQPHSADPTSGFLCTEPWVGVPDSLTSGQGRVTLLPAESFTWAMHVAMS